jgi:predicted DNA-binding transcriptional regulator YafY
MRCRKKLDQCRSVYRYVAQGGFPSRQDITDRLEDRELALITTDPTEFKRLLKSIDSEFDIHIEYNPQERGYYIAEGDDYDDTQNLIELYEMADSVGFRADSLNDLEKLTDFIQVSHSKYADNREHIPNLLTACIRSREVIFSYRKYGHELQEATIRKVQPYQIRESEGRWYLIGIEPGLIEVEPHREIVKFRAYGLDRMFNVLSGNKFIRRNEKAFNEHYADVIGIENGYNYQEGTHIPAEKIRFKADKLTWNYIKTLPWHHSQKLIATREDYVEFELFVKPTSELVRLILKWSPKVEVIKPVSLRNSVLAELKKSVALYS